ncbi:PD-(D/E)XK nuclease family protein [Desulfococcaceae bacterium HSG9]|nr:PD-(D/E)XK nuclease family protein [Desulfococcaceae bacterium HSG9]
MNIFKVLASGKKSFQEETASAILAWFMNPAMEHGLGYSFISKFVNDLAISLNNSELFDLSSKLTPRLRGEYEDQLKLWFNLEYNVDNAFIDIIMGIDDWIFAIENKIYAKSVTQGQLLREYEGLKKKDPNAKIGMVYLVPVEEGSEILDGKTEKEFENLSVRDTDFKSLVTWQKNDIENVPSISEQIYGILNDERKGEIDPVSEYTRHTLKALMAFISNNFSGYEYERTNQSSGMNSCTEDKLPITKLKFKDSGYVGVKGAIKGLLRMGSANIKKHSFQYTSQDMSQKAGWLEINQFNKITDWIVYKKISEIDWRGRLTSNSLYLISKDFGLKVFIGIRGGENALRNMSADEIKNKEWNISTEKTSKEWIEGNLFCEIIDSKNI